MELLTNKSLYDDDAIDNATTDDAQESNPDTLLTATKMLDTVCPPVILTFGTFGNLMTLVVLATMSGSSSSSLTVYFSALAVSDLTLLYTALLRRWMIVLFHFEIREKHDVLCRLHLFLVYTSGQTSAWFLVAMTLQRVACVIWPHRVGVLCTRRKAQVTVVVITLLLVALNLHFFVVYTLAPFTDSNNVTKLICDVYDLNTPLSYYDYHIYPWIDLCVTSLVPASLLLVGNAILGSTVSQALRETRKMTSQQAENASARKKAASSMTMTLMAVSVTYLILTLPVCACAIMMAFVTYGKDTQFDVLIDMMWALANLLWYCNASVNFYIYVLTGTKFRQQCLWLFSCDKQRQARPGTTIVSIAISMTTASRTAWEKTRVTEVNDHGKNANGNKNDDDF